MIFIISLQLQGEPCTSQNQSILISHYKPTSRKSSALGISCIAVKGQVLYKYKWTLSLNLQEMFARANDRSID
jgi:hypothetical protein